MQGERLSVRVRMIMYRLTLSGDWERGQLMPAALSRLCCTCTYAADIVVTNARTKSYSRLAHESFACCAGVKVPTLNLLTLAFYLRPAVCDCRSHGMSFE